MLKGSKSYRYPAKKFYIRTYGCQMNKNDSSIIAQLLHDNGYEYAQDPNLADIFIVNTCSVREHAEQRALGYIAGLKNWHSQKKRVLAVVGCMAERLADHIVTQFPFVDLILGPDSYRQISKFVNEVFKHNTKILDTALGNEMYCGIYPRRNTIADFISIMRGCDNFCSYCIVPRVRGRSRSRPLEDITAEVGYIIDKGVKDVTLLGQNVNEYSYEDKRFADLLNILASISGLCRLRFLTSHPKDLNDAIINAVKMNKNVCEWFHLPLQSGNDRILELMNRKYTKEYYLNLVADIRKEIPEATITTDVIVGFPTETEEEFMETIAFMDKVQFDDAYMYRYSPRKGTKAYAYEPLPEEVIKSRLKRLIDFQHRKNLKKTRNMVGRKYEVLFEVRLSDGKTRGKTRGNKSVVVEQDITPGEVREVIIKEVRGNTPIGMLVE
jgi:tRNA-2-methylthio-N6-dimethylallyladenosine synthase